MRSCRRSVTNVRHGYGRAGQGLAVVRPAVALSVVGLVTVLFSGTASADETKPTQPASQAPAAATPSTDASTDKTVADKNAADKNAADKNAADKPAAEPAAPADANATFLHVQSPTTIRIENSQTGQVVCTSPCDKPVPSTTRYRVGGARPSSDFVLASVNGRADVKVKPASHATFWTGVGALTLGGLLIGGGVGVFVYGVENRPPVPGGDGTETNNTFTDTMSIGSALAIAGTISALVGAAVMVSNYSSKVRGDLSTTARLDPNPKTPAPRAANLAQSPLPKTTFAPLFGGTF
jgi:hypothetical protein